ncbi:MAG TPA: hypothetical protein VKE26_17695 [Xanthobacteraceae bacterium]|nr:hypothetical protein [Xanthobacteraceae bacterium]
MTIRTAKLTISLVWMAGAIPLLLILIVRQLAGFYETDPKVAWTWAAQYLFPTLTLIGGAWSVASSAAEDTPMSSTVVVWGAILLSVFYIAVLYLILGAQAVSIQPAQTIFEQSGLYLSLLNALVVGWLGKFFVESKR